ncbi:hypothetical protein FRC03_007239 [Tulasnella sp. 419]|nr:hypothetical protein FRC03_007239 [Tulasnella sp. 419]
MTDQNGGSSPARSVCESEVMWQASQAVDLNAILRKRTSTDPQSLSRKRIKHHLGDSPDSPIEIDASQGSPTTPNIGRPSQTFNVGVLGPSSSKSHPSISRQGSLTNDDGDKATMQQRRNSTLNPLSRARRSRQTLSPTPSQPPSAVLSQNSGSDLQNMIRRFGTAMRERVMLKEDTSSNPSQSRTPARSTKNGLPTKSGSADYISRPKERRLMDRTNSQPTLGSAGFMRGHISSEAKMDLDKDEDLPLKHARAKLPERKHPIPAPDRSRTTLSQPNMGKSPQEAPPKSSRSLPSIPQVDKQGVRSMVQPTVGSHQNVGTSQSNLATKTAGQAVQQVTLTPPASQPTLSQSNRRLGMTGSAMSHYPHHPYNREKSAVMAAEPPSDIAKPKSLGIRVNAKGAGAGPRGFKVPFKTTQASRSVETKSVSQISVPHVVQPVQEHIMQYRPEVQMDVSMEDESVTNAGDSSFSSFECDLEELDAVMGEYEGHS